MPLQSAQTESGLYNYGLSPHQPREGQRGGGIRPRAVSLGWEVIGARSLAQIVFYRLPRVPLCPRSDRRSSALAFFLSFFFQFSVPTIHAMEEERTLRMNDDEVSNFRKDSTRVSSFQDFTRFRNVFIGRYIYIYTRPVNIRCRGYKIGERAF